MTYALGDITGSVDSDIAGLVRALREPDWMTTLSSCSGHGKASAYVTVAVKGAKGIKKLVALFNQVHFLTGDDLPYIEIFLSWDEEVEAACDFEERPDWFVFNLQFGINDDDAPTIDQLTLLTNTVRKILLAWATLPETQPKIAR